MGAFGAARIRSPLEEEHYGLRKLEIRQRRRKVHLLLKLATYLDVSGPPHTRN